MLLTLIILGFAFIILLMIVFINPPEAWLKKVFHPRPRAAEKTKDRE